MIRRVLANPIIRPAMLPGNDGANINGPSLLRVPEWVPGALGRYYLYFAHHGGHYIRLAYADALEGPWRIYEPGVLQLADAAPMRGHIASPDVVVDERARQIRLYFHGPAPHADYQQSSAVALSTDGLHFVSRGEIIAPYYLRVFPWRGAWYGMVWGGQLFRSPDGLRPFESVYGDALRFTEYIRQSTLAPEVVTQPSPLDPLFFGRADEEGGGHLRVRHVAVDPRIDDGRLMVYFSCTGGFPERVQRAWIDLRPDWRQWRAEALEEVARPEMPWEGADLPLVKSRNGAAGMDGEHALRYPEIFRDADGSGWLLYSVRGEKGLAIAEMC